MTQFDAFRYDGKRALVVGGASGMGEAAAELLQDAGAEVVVMDIAEVSMPKVSAVHVDLTDRASIEAAVDGCGGPVHALLSCAGVADGTPGIERINFVGQRYLIDRMLAQDLLPRGAAIGMIASVGGLGWEKHLPVLSELLDIADFDEATRWMHEHGKAGYMGTKQAVLAYVAREAVSFLKRGIRINATCPGAVDTPLARRDTERWLGWYDDYRAETGIELCTPLEQAYPLVFLCSGAASAIAGSIQIADSGYMSAGVTGSFPANTAMANLYLNY